MQAQPLFLETDALGNLKQVPKLPPNKRVEVTFSVVEALPVSSTSNQRRIPHPDIAGKAQILGDIYNSVPATDWNLPE